MVAGGDFIEVISVDGFGHTLADNDWHLSATATLNALTGGMDLSTYFTNDKDGFTRTDDGGGFGWSIGAYERD